MIVTSAILLLLGRRFSIPSIVLFIVAGLILGPLTGLINLTAVFTGGHGQAGGIDGAIAWMAEFGIALLLFLVGLELSLDKIRDVGAVAVAAGLGQVVFTGLIGFGLAMMLGFTPVESFFLATALTFSSTVVVVKLLDQKKEIHSLYGRIAIGIFLVQDMVVILALTFLAGLGSGGNLAWGVARAFAGVAFLLAVVLMAARWMLPRPFAWAARSPETLLLWSLCWCSTLVIAAEFLHLSPEIGAFLAGMSLAQLSAVKDLHHRVQPLMNFFVALFFVALGAQMQLSQAGEQLIPALILSLFVLLGNPLIFMLIIARFGYSEVTCFKTSVTVAQISEFSFVFAAMGMSTGLIGESILAIVAVVGLVTIIVSSYMILYSDALYAFCRRLRFLWLFRASQAEDVAPPPPHQGHVVVIGMNTLGRLLVRGLIERQQTVLAVDTDSRKLQDLDCETVLGNVEYLSVLQHAGFESARLVISALQIEDTNHLVAYRCQQAGVGCAIHAFDASLHAGLRALGIEFLLDSREMGGREVESRLEL